MSRQRAFQTIVGLASPDPNNLPAAVVREQARLAAADPLINKGKAYFVYCRIAPQPDTTLAEQISTKNTDVLADAEKFRDSCLKDDRVIWVGIWDNTTKKLVSDSIGPGNVLLADQTQTSAPAAAQSGGSKAPIILGALAAAVGLFAISRKG